MRIALAHNLRTEDVAEQAELLPPDLVERLRSGLAALGHAVTPVEVSGPLEEVVDRLLKARPELIFNTAEGLSGPDREARYPAIYERLGLPYTGAGPSVLFVDLDKRLTERLLEHRGLKVPHGAVLTPDAPELPNDLSYPVIAKPNLEGSSRGITQKSVAGSREEAEEVVRELLEEFPDGVVIEELIEGRELVVPRLQAWPGHLLELVEHRFPEGRHAIFDYELKREGNDEGVETICPPELEPELRAKVEAMARRAFEALPCPDLGRLDLRLKDDQPYFIEVNPLPSLHPDASLPIGARAVGLDYERMLELIVQSAARRWGLSLKAELMVVPVDRSGRPTAREAGLSVGAIKTGPYNAITDVAGVKVGHVTVVEDEVPVPGGEGKTTSIRTGVTAILPAGEDLFENHMVSGGFILNGIGEMAGLIQVMQWGWLETPILLTNTMSLGAVHSGIIRHMIAHHPELGKRIDVVIPVVGETNDGFLNDVRVPTVTPELAMKAISSASSGAVEQGSVGGGTGMISFDFAGGIGTSSRVLSRALSGYTVGVLVQSNFGKMRNLTIDGAVVGRQLDKVFPDEGRRGRQYGSVVVIVATDAPLLSTQLESLSKRAALGLGRVGSFARSTSGEIICAFSTGNRVSRRTKERSRRLKLEFVNDELINPLYEATVEATEEAVLNALFCSGGMTGREGRFAPALPVESVLDMLRRGRDLERRTRG